MSEPARLCTVAEVKRQVRTASTVNDAQITELVDAATELLVIHTARELIAPNNTPPLTRAFGYDGSGTLFLAPYDLQSTTAIVVDSDTTFPVTLTTNDYTLGPKPSRWGVFEWVELPGFGRRSSGRTREVSITGVWGFPSVPKVAKQACIVAVRAWLTRDGGFAFSDTSQGNAQPAAPNSYSLPDASKKLVKSLRVLGVR